MIAHFIVKAAQNLGPAINQRGVHAQPIENTGKLHRNIAAANDDDILRQRLNMKRLIGADSVFNTLNLRHERRAADSHQNIFGSDVAPVQRHRVCVFHNGATLQNFNTGGFKVFDINTVQSVNLGIFVFHQCRPIEFGIGHRPTETGRIFKLFGEMAGIDKQLFRHAAANNACAADAIFFRHRHFRAMACAHARRAHAAAARADNKKIVIKTHKLPTSSSPSEPAKIAAVA